MQIVDGVCVGWSDEDGWGYHSLRAGQRVWFEVEPYLPGQDGYFFRDHNVAII